MEYGSLQQLAYPLRELSDTAKDSTCELQIVNPVLCLLHHHATVGMLPFMVREVK